ncbi:MAG: ribonuclease P protein component 4, partial [Halobacteriaceae archaeon]
MDADRIAAERIDRLASLAREATRAGEADLAREYVRLARRLAERHRLRLPRPLRRRTCSACDRYQVPGVNVQVRLQDGHVVRTCDCGDQA